MESNEIQNGLPQTKSLLIVVGSIATFVIPTILGLYYNLNNFYEKRQETLNIFEEKIKQRELIVLKKELDLVSKENDLSKRENVLHGNEHLYNNNYRMNSLLNDYKIFSGIDLSAQNNACIAGNTFDKNKCIEVTEKRQQAFSLLNQLCLLAKNENKVDQSFKDFIYSEKIRLDDYRNNICNDIARVNWKD